MSTNYLGSNTFGIASPAAAVPEGAPKLLYALKRESFVSDTAYDIYQAEIEGWGHKLAPLVVPEGALPPLPKPVRMSSDQAYLGFTSDQMQAYARAAVEADRAQRPTTPSAVLPRYKLMPGDTREWLVPAEDGPWCKYEHALASIAAVSADRAQQGEPVYQYIAGKDTWVDCNKAFYDACPKYNYGRRIVYHAATKAAAPDDAPKLTRNEIEDMAFAYCPSGQIGELQDFAAALLARVAAPAPERAKAQPGIPTAGDLARKST